jgi:hypothetical protein
MFQPDQHILLVIERQNRSVSEMSLHVDMFQAKYHKKMQYGYHHVDFFQHIFRKRRKNNFFYCHILQESIHQTLLSTNVRDRYIRI